MKFTSLSQIGPICFSWAVWAWTQTLWYWACSPQFCCGGRRSVPCSTFVCNSWFLSQKLSRWPLAFSCAGDSSPSNSPPKHLSYLWGGKDWALGEHETTQAQWWRHSTSKGKSALPAETTGPQHSASSRIWVVEFFPCWRDFSDGEQPWCLNVAFVG